MSNRDALKKLSSQFPAPPELARILDDLRQGSDLNAVIVSTAILESLLERVLIKVFKQSDATFIGQMFKNRGPASDFHGKILIAQAMGVIGGMGPELHRIKAIRNTFAHAKVPVTFTTPAIAKEMESVLILNAISDVPTPEGKPKIPFPRDKGGFLLNVRIICIVLDYAHRDRGGEPLLGDDPPGTSPGKSPLPPPPHSKKPDHS